MAYEDYPDVKTHEDFTVTVEFPCTLNDTYTLNVDGLVNQDYYIGDPLMLIDLTGYITAEPDEYISGICWEFSMKLMEVHPLPADDPNAIELDLATKQVSVFTEKFSSAGDYHLRYSAIEVGTGVELAHHQLLVRLITPCHNLQVQRPVTPVDRTYIIGAADGSFFFDPYILDMSECQLTYMMFSQLPADD